MFRHIFLLLMLYLSILPLSAQNEAGILLDLLPGLTDADPAGIYYLIDIFPRNEIDFTHLSETDLDRLFFLSPEGRTVLWKNRLKLKTRENLNNLSLSAAEKKLLQLCWRDPENALRTEFFGAVKTAEEASSCFGNRFAHKQKLSVTGNSWSGKISLQKDTGEPLAVDSYNGYFSYTNQKYLLGIGSYFISFGEGIILSRPVFSNYKTPVTTARKGLIIPYSGTDEVFPRRGVFSAYSNKAFNVSFAWSRNFFDAVKEEKYFRIKTTGYHRTQAELNAKNALRGENLFIGGLIKLSGAVIGGAVNYFRFPSPVIYSGNLFPASGTSASILLRAGKEKGFATEFVLYPAFSGVIKGYFKDRISSLDIRMYYYGSNPSFTGRHLIFNTLPIKSGGINIRFKSKLGEKISGGGYFLFENRFQKRENYLYSGIYFSLDASRVALSLKQRSGDFISYTTRLDLQYRLRLLNVDKYRFTLTTGLSSAGIGKTLRSRYLSLRYRIELLNNFKILLNFMAWSGFAGERIWLYSDGLPESFEIINTSGTGSYFNLQFRYRLSSVEFFYLFGKQHNLPPEENYPVSLYRSTHQIGIRISQ
jgi:hypothetical protein